MCRVEHLDPEEPTLFDITDLPDQEQRTRTRGEHVLHEQLEHVLELATPIDADAHRMPIRMLMVALTGHLDVTGLGVGRTCHDGESDVTHLTTGRRITRNSHDGPRAAKESPMLVPQTRQKNIIKKTNMSII